MKKSSQLISVFLGFLVILVFVYILQKSGVIQEGFQTKPKRCVVFEDCAADESCEMPNACSRKGRRPKGIDCNSGFCRKLKK